MRLRLVLSKRQITFTFAVSLLTLHPFFCSGDAIGKQEVFDSHAVPVCVEQAVEDESQSVTVKACIGTEAVSVQPQDEIWIVSTRQNARKNCEAIEFHTQRLQCSQWWSASLDNLAACHQSDPDHITVVIVHGNNTKDEWALTRGMQFYDRMFGQVPCDRPAVRLVILAWESAQELPRPGPDYKIKSARAVALGAGVGSFLDTLGGDRPVLVGYSLGVQVVLSTLTHQASSIKDLAGSCGPGYQVGLIAPALDGNYACDCLQMIPTNPLIQRAEIFVNRHDRVVLAARVLNRKRCENRCTEPSLVGLADAGRLDASRFRLDDVTQEVRNRHSLVNYIQSSTVRNRVRQLVLNAASQRIVAADSVVDTAVPSENLELVESVSTDVQTLSVDRPVLP